MAGGFTSATKVGGDQGCILEQTGESIEQVWEGSASPGPVEQSIYSGSDVDAKSEEMIWQDTTTTFDSSDHSRK